MAIYLRGYIIPSVLRAFGFPVWKIHIDPTPSGASQSEWTVSLPEKVKEGLTHNFKDSNLLLSLGNGIGLYSCGNGLKEDGIKKVTVLIEGGVKPKEITLMEEE